MDDDMVTWLKHGEHEEINRLLRARVNENLFGLDCFVEITNLFSQRWTSLRFGITQPDVLKSLRRALFHGKQIRNGHGLTVRTAEQIFGGEFVFDKVAFEFEGREVHD